MRSVFRTRSNLLQHHFSFLRGTIKDILSFTTITITITLFVEILTAISLMKRTNNHDTEPRATDISAGNFMRLLYSTQVMLQILTYYAIWTIQRQCPIHISIEDRMFEISENFFKIISHVPYGFLTH
jgi:heme/copper-type cytochrome/quinol oxidase subunit 2